MRLTSAQVEDLLREIIEEDSEYQKLLINDRINYCIEGNADLLERLIEKAWDEVFGFDEERMLSDEMNFDHLAFHRIRDKLLNSIKEGAEVKPIVQALGSEQGIFSLPEIQDSDSLSKVDIENWIREYTPWRHKLHHIIVVQKLLEIYAERYLNPQAYPPSKDIKWNKERAAIYIFCEGIPDEARPSDWESKQNTEQFNKKGPLESKDSVKWQYLDSMFGYKDQVGKRLFDAYSNLQTTFDRDALGDEVEGSLDEFNDPRKKTRGLRYYIRIAEDLPLTTKGKARLQKLRDIVELKGQSLSNLNKGN